MLINGRTGLFVNITVISKLLLDNNKGLAKLKNVDTTEVAKRALILTASAFVPQLNRRVPPGLCSPLVQHGLMPG